MVRYLTWQFIVMLMRRRKLLWKHWYKKTTTLYETTLIEAEIFRALRFTDYTVREASKQTITTYSDNIVQLVEWVNGAYLTVENAGYIPEKWNLSKRTEARKFLDDYFSDNGFDVKPDNIVKQIAATVIDIIELCEATELKDTVRGNYYRRHFTHVMEDSVTILVYLRKQM